MKRKGIYDPPVFFGRQVYLKYSMDEMSVYAAQASFFIIMAAFPFFAVLLIS